MSGSARRFRVPIFPLTSVVLFPGTSVPLHVFEPRYRQLAADALRGDRRIGMVTIRPDSAHRSAGDPPVFEVGCLGSITHSRQLEDGRYHMLLLGEQRFRICDEPQRPEDRLYRVAEVEPLVDALEPHQRETAALLRTRVSDRLSRLVGRSDPAEAPESELLGDADDALFVNMLCQLLELPSREKQALLEADGILPRYARLAEILEFQLAALATGDGGGPTRLH